MATTDPQAIKRELIAQKFQELQDVGVTPQDLLNHSMRVGRKQEAARMATAFAGTVTSYPSLPAMFWNKIKVLAGNQQLPVAADWSIALDEAQDALEADDPGAFLKALVMLFMCANRQRPRM